MANYEFQCTENTQTGKVTYLALKNGCDKPRISLSAGARKALQAPLEHRR
jgi:hypothetical protein